MYILYCDIFWWKLIDRIFVNQMFDTKVVSQGIPLFPISTALHINYLKTRCSYMLDIS